MTQRQMQAAGAIGLAIGATALGKTLASGQGAAFGLSALETSVLVGLGATVLVAVMASRSA
jgi:hypothetical protein